VADLVDELVDTSYSILAPHATYISAGQDDQNRYFIPPEVLEALSWIATSIVVPMLTGVATDLIKQRFVPHKGDTPDLPTLQAEVNQLQGELRALAERRPRQTEEWSGAGSTATAHLAETLQTYGWPTSVANTDAAKIVHEIQEQLVSYRSAEHG
jgi:hypothetical protein